MYVLCIVCIVFIGLYILIIVKRKLNSSLIDPGQMMLVPSPPSLWMLLYSLYVSPSTPMLSHLQLARNKNFIIIILVKPLPLLLTLVLPLLLPLHILHPVGHVSVAPAVPQPAG